MKLLCKKCGSDEIEQKEWRKVNSGKFSGDTENGTEDQWCPVCEEHVEFVSEEEYDSDDN